MDLIRRFQAGHLAKRLQDPLQAADGVAQTQEKLLALGPSAVRGLLDAIARGKASPASIEVLERLCTNDTLAVFIEALMSPVPAVVEAASVALSRSALYDPAQLLGLFSEPNVSMARLESILAAQMQRIQPVTLVRVLPDLSKDARGSVFRLLERRADSSISADVVGLARHAEWWLRLHAVKLLAKMPGQDAIAGVAELLKDESAAVRLEAAGRRDRDTDRPRRRLGGPPPARLPARRIGVRAARRGRSAEPGGHHRGHQGSRLRPA